MVCPAGKEVPCNLSNSSAAQFTGSPIETKPSFNVMIGPSSYMQIYMGSRYTPCMKNVPGIQNANETILFSCPNATTSATECTLSEACGFSGVPNPHPHGSLDDKPAPNQWFRFIIPMFIHTGFIHIGFNLIVQLTMGVDMERMIGWWRYFLVYVASGIWGFVLGGNYAGQGEASCGCSGALFGILALFILDLLYTWKDRASPWVELIIMILGIAVSFVLGLLPGLDNFAHIGGFIMGLALGLCLLRSPNALRERIGLARNPYVAMSGGAGTPTPDDSQKVNTGPSLVDFLKGRRTRAGAGASNNKLNPVNFFRGRKPLWWAWWLVRAGALVAVLVGFILLIVDFYKYPKSNCSWCYRLSCLVRNAMLVEYAHANCVAACQWMVQRRPIDDDNDDEDLLSDYIPKFSFFTVLYSLVYVWSGFLGYPVASAVIIYQGSISGVWDTCIWCCSCTSDLCLYHSMGWKSQ